MKLVDISETKTEHPKGKINEDKKQTVIANISETCIGTVMYLRRVTSLKLV
jgi:hypothetical protein